MENGSETLLIFENTIGFGISSSSAVYPWHLLQPDTQTKNQPLQKKYLHKNHNMQKSLI